jgi:hypothetical protein
MKLLACTTAFVVVIFSNLLCYADANKLWNDTDIDTLRKDLLDGYEINSRPSQANDANSLHVAMTLINIDLDENRGVLTSHAWIKMNWSDIKLRWDPLKYNNIQQIRMGADEIWTPDLTVYNSAEHNIVDHFAKTNKIAYPNGMVLWVPTAKIETYCKMNLVNWPFDKQTCIIKLGSWTYSGNDINLQLDNNRIDMSEFNDNSEWTIIKTKVERHSTIYPCCPEPYSDVTFEITFKRSSTMFKAIVVSPVMVIIFMTLVSFWLPPQSGEKLLLNGTACILICLLLLYFSQVLTIHASSSPFIVTFYSNTLYLLCFSFIVSVIVINISRNEKHYAVPRCIRRNILEGCIGKMFGGGAPKPVVDDDEESDDPQEVRLHQHNHAHDEQKIAQSSLSLNTNVVDTVQAQWIRLAKVIDRSAFVIYVLVYITIGALHYVRI